VCPRSAPLVGGLAAGGHRAEFLKLPSAVELTRELARTCRPMRAQAYETLRATLGWQNQAPSEPAAGPGRSFSARRREAPAAARFRAAASISCRHRRRGRGRTGLTRNTAAIEHDDFAIGCLSILSSTSETNAWCLAFLARWQDDARLSKWFAVEARARAARFVETVQRRSSPTRNSR